MKHKVIGLVREKAVESTVGSPATGLAQIMLASVLMQFLLFERKVIRERRKRTRKA